MSTTAALPKRSLESGPTLQPGRAPRPAPGTVRGLSLLPVADGLWRVVTRNGAVLGHIERTTDGIDERFAARRLLASTRTTALGTFWNIDDAADCFR
ncbi:hypothetical protein RCH16_000847 [Cryobacterium sp. MP_M5]|uniref:hypothetical protein n=1 Tax=unclassified Cryobacterium TaxID=2649013 RepID=UPI0018C92654|nr:MULTISPECIES: hypothetical protein [unclassified Cryobacterium]MBG6057631.1 hypothetical protein [Cryobacterium sp. MP_M3]MEC5175854.1 hypothetical protein [Cryobacterium sp. MP_M5]